MTKIQKYYIRFKWKYERLILFILINVIFLNKILLK